LKCEKGKKKKKGEEILKSLALVKWRRVIAEREYLRRAGTTKKRVSEHD